MSQKASGRVAELERRIADLRARLPKHSTPPAMLIELEELEEAWCAAGSEEPSEDLDDSGIV